MELCGRGEELFERGLRTIRMAVDGKTTDPELLANWGVLLLEYAHADLRDESGEMAEAGLAKIEQAVQVDPENVVAVSAFAYAARELVPVLWHRDVSERALACLERALQSHPDAFGLLAERALLIAQLAWREPSEARLHEALRAARAAAGVESRGHAWRRFWDRLGTEVGNAARAIAAKEQQGDYWVLEPAGAVNFTGPTEAEES